MPYKKHLVAALTALALASGAYATPLIGASDISFGENTNPVQSVSGDPVLARNAFMSKLNGTAGSFGFEDPNSPGWSLGTADLPVDFNNGSNGTGSNPITATLSGAGVVLDLAGSGRFNTTAGGSHYLSVDSGTEFDISFDTAIAAFGFYGTDIGDFGGTLTAYLKHAGSSEEDEFIIRSGANAAPSGSLLFWGFASVNASYDKIRFVATGTSQTDVFGFDDFVVADSSQIRLVTPPPLPEPGTLALAGLALLGAAAARRRR
jgi:hypothetical protein